MSVAQRMRRVATGRRVASWVVVAVLAALAVGIASLAPGWTMRWAPFPGVGAQSATSGPLTVEVHGATLASSIVVDGETETTNGVFVVVDVTIAATDDVGVLARDLVIDGVVFDASPKGPSAYRESDPALGLPVSGSFVFEVDAALVGPGASGELLVAQGFDASGDLAPQVRVQVPLDGSVVDAVEPQVLAR